MPELPEVETVKNAILPLIKNKTIEKVDIFYNRLIQSDFDEFNKKILNKTIIDVKRYGKYIFFDLSEDYILIIHLRMEGKFSFNEKGKNPRISSTSLIFYFTDQTSLSFNDTRKFGLMYLTTKSEIYSLKMMQKLGVEANKVEEKDYGTLIKKLKRNKPIKELLLDQSIMCGIGNIYADETLFRSNINPLTKGKDLTEEDFISIFKNAKIVLNKAIKLGGSSVHTFSSNGIDGKFQNELLCYGKENEPCPNCGTRFHKIFLGGRGTTFCPNCQINKDYKKAIGITGKIGSGKSTVLSYLAKKDYLTLSSDEVVHELYKIDYIKAKMSKILKLNFDLSNEETRLKVRKIMIEKPEIKKQVEDYIYPILEDYFLKKIVENDKIAIEVPLLFKAHYEYMFKKILVIEVNENIQKEHLTIRGDDISSSLSLNKDYKNKNNHDIVIINNDGSLKDLYKKIDKELDF